MKMSKMFISVFDETLTEMGYIRKGNCYSKLENEILYGVFLKPINPYCIDFTAIPYWALDDAQLNFDAPLYKGVWVERCYLVELDSGLYYKEQFEEDNITRMRSLLQVAKEYALPYINSIKNVEDFARFFSKKIIDDGSSACYCYETAQCFEVVRDNVNSGYGSRYFTANFEVMFGRFVTPYILLDIAQKRNSYDGIREFIERYLIKKGMQYPKVLEELRYPDFLVENIEANSFDFIRQYKREKSRRFLPRLRDELNLDTSTTLPFD